MTYRIAKFNDVKEILEIIKDIKAYFRSIDSLIWGGDYPNFEDIEQDIIEERGRVLEIDQKIIGYFAFITADEYESPNFKNHHLISFGRIMIDINYQGQGYGKRLTQMCIDEAKMQGYEGIGILVDKENMKAIKTYQSFGFKFIETREYPWAILDEYLLLFSNE